MEITGAGLSMKSNVTCNLCFWVMLKPPKLTADSRAKKGRTPNEPTPDFSESQRRSPRLERGKGYVRKAFSRPWSISAHPGCRLLTGHPQNGGASRLRRLDSESDTQI